MLSLQAVVPLRPAGVRRPARSTVGYHDLSDMQRHRQQRTGSGRISPSRAISSIEGPQDQSQREWSDRPPELTNTPTSSARPNRLLHAPLLIQIRESLRAQFVNLRDLRRYCNIGTFRALAGHRRRGPIGGVPLVVPSTCNSGLLVGRLTVPRKNLNALFCIARPAQTRQRRRYGIGQWPTQPKTWVPFTTRCGPTLYTS
jgi:hypothetical protein